MISDYGVINEEMLLEKTHAVYLFKLVLSAGAFGMMWNYHVDDLYSCYVVQIMLR